MYSKIIFHFTSAKNPDANLFLTPRRCVDIEDEEIWYYENRPVGENTIGLFMKKISKDAGCSREYTNQCVGRATTVTKLNKIGFTDEQILLLTRHHNVEGM